MNKSDVVNEVHKELKQLGFVSKSAESKEIVDVVLNTLHHSLKSGRDVQLTGFGTFAVKPQTFNDVNNPNNKITRMVIKFTPSRVLKERLNEKIR